MPVLPTASAPVPTRPRPLRPASARPAPVVRPMPPAARTQAGITTAEYAVGTAAGAGLAGLLYKLLTGGFGEELLKALFQHVLALLGIG